MDLSQVAPQLSPALGSHTMFGSLWVAAAAVPFLPSFAFGAFYPSSPFSFCHVRLGGPRGVAAH